MDDNLQRASEADHATRKYFDHLVSGNAAQAEISFKALFQKGYV
jgi:hypothetical protein